ncbi:MAG TPA: hypothetical protein VJ349_19240 [Stellaceae bacterium]|jgi:hypothetical protein|nr:hypothetical protein [Stellaceae bacterium]
MVLSTHADLTGQPAETASGDSAALAISRKGSTKQWGLAVSSFAEPSAAQDFCANEISMADDLLQITAKTAGRDVRLPTPPGGLMHLMNASER